MENGTYNMDQLSQQFTLQLTPGNLKNGMKENGAKSNELWTVPLERLRPIAGFNVRVRNAKYFARVRKYADSMKEYGYFPHKPMAGYMGKDPLTGENVVFYTAGHTRHESILLANSELPEEKQIKAVTVVMQPPKTTTMRQLNALLITENDAAALDPYEASIVCKRLLDDGSSVEEIAKEVNFSTEWVDSLLQLAAAPRELQLMIVDDVIKPTFAIETIKEHGGEQALVILKQALARKTGGKPDAQETEADAESGVDAGADGDETPAPAPKKVRLTAKDLTSPEVRKFQNVIKREAPVMYDALKQRNCGPGLRQDGRRYPREAAGADGAREEARGVGRASCRPSPDRAIRESGGSCCCGRRREDFGRLSSATGPARPARRPLLPYPTHVRTRPLSRCVNLLPG